MTVCRIIYTVSAAGLGTVCVLTIHANLFVHELIGSSLCIQPHPNECVGPCHSFVLLSVYDVSKDLLGIVSMTISGDVFQLYTQRALAVHV